MDQVIKKSTSLFKQGRIEGGVNKKAKALKMRSEGASYREISKSLGCSLGSVHNWLNQRVATRSIKPSGVDRQRSDQPKLVQQVKPVQQQDVQPASPKIREQRTTGFLAEVFELTTLAGGGSIEFWLETIPDWNWHSHLPQMRQDYHQNDPSSFGKHLLRVYQILQDGSLTVIQEFPL